MSGTLGLNPSDLVQATLSFNPPAVPTANFGTELIIGNSAVIPAGERVRIYSGGTAGMTTDGFTNNSPEFLAAELYFSQSPQPLYLAVGVQATGETALQAVQACLAASNAWYAIQLVSPGLVTADYQAVGAFTESTGPGGKLLGITTSDSGALDPASTTDMASALKAMNLSRTCMQYSSGSPYAVGSLMARGLITNWNAQNTAYTLMYKQEPGVTAEILSETQAAALKAKFCNVLADYQNGATPLQYGTMTNGYYFDEIHGTDWFLNALQTALFNAFYTTPTKIPQTDAGTDQLEVVLAAVCQQAKANGLLYPGGTWTSGLTFGTLTQGQTLASGYYIYAPPYSTQSQADRQQRKSVPIQLAAILSGAVHTANLLVNIQR